jgi:hypothetical protein
MAKACVRIPWQKMNGVYSDIRGSRPLSAVSFTAVTLVKFVPVIATLSVEPVLGETEVTVGADRREGE